MELPSFCRKWRRRSCLLKMNSFLLFDPSENEISSEKIISQLLDIPEAARQSLYSAETINVIVNSSFHFNSVELFAYNA